MKTIEINEIAKYIDAAPTQMNLMFIGDTGIGKTQSVEKYCKDRGIFLKTLILSQLDASEALGIPVKVEKEYGGKKYQVLDTAVPSWVFDLAEHEKAILFLDEFLCANPSVMNSFLNFLSQKNVNGIDLSHVKVISATNIGMYTTEPDSNILSRFCMFYTVNSTAKDFVGDKRIMYKYEDINQKTGSIFDVRSLKPRCYYQLSLVKDNALYYHFYEGFTNTQYAIIYPENEKINDIFLNYVESNGRQGEFTISEANIDCLVAVLKKKMRIRNGDAFCNKLQSLDEGTLIRLRNKLAPETAKNLSVSTNEKVAINF